LPVALPGLSDRAGVAGVETDRDPHMTAAWAYVERRIEGDPAIALQENL
jgi:hypothetical protein